MAETRSSTRFLEHLSWGELPAEVRAELRELAPLLIEGRSFREISRHVGVDDGAVGQRVARARQAILEAVGGG